jgi:hypothetical protein
VNKNEKRMALQQVLQMTLDMQHNAQSESWDDVINVEQQRKALLDKVFPIETFDAELSALIEQIRDLNNLIEAQCSKAKGELQKELSDMNKNKRAMNAYLMP